MTGSVIEISWPGKNGIRFLFFVRFGCSMASNK